MGNTPASYKSCSENRFRLDIGEMTPVSPTVNDPNHYKEYNTDDSKSEALLSGVFYTCVAKSEEFLKTRGRIQLKEFEEHTVKAGTFSIFDTVQGCHVGLLDYYKTLTVETVDVCRAIDIILKNLYQTDPIDGVERINVKYFNIMNCSTYIMEELFIDYEHLKKYGFWCTLYFDDCKLSGDLLNYKQVLTQFRKQPVAEEIYANMAFCNFGEGKDLVIVKEENLYLSTALINFNEYIKIGYEDRFHNSSICLFAYELKPPSYEEVVSDNELESI